MIPALFTLPARYSTFGTPILLSLFNVLFSFGTSSSNAAVIISPAAPIEASMYNVLIILPHMIYSAGHSSGSKSIIYISIPFAHELSIERRVQVLQMKRHIPHLLEPQLQGSRKDRLLRLLKLPHVRNHNNYAGIHYFIHV